MQLVVRLQLRKPMKEKKAFHMTYVPPISRLEPKECDYFKISDATAYSQLMQAMSYEL